MDYLAGLNESQRGAVEQITGPVMIVAGAGSGKTRVITYRVAHLIKKGVDPFNILVLTFTNKAAKEMRERISTVVGSEAKNIWMGTFHSVFARILRSQADKLGYPRNFTIYDTDDTKSLLRTIIKEMNLDDKVYNVNHVYGRISAAKNNLVSPQEYIKNQQVQAEDREARKPHLGQIYLTYAQRCFKAGAMDFDDLLFKTNVLLHKFPDVLHHYQHQFKYVMVDEYQDTNFSQYLIIKRLAAVHENICVVGDDAQSIYAFRGANIQNILNFQKDYPDVRVFKLEQNYRSTQTIVQAANSIIAKNKNQLEKKVFSENEEGEKIKIHRAYSDNEEGKLVAESILEAKANNQLHYKDFALLYRTNAQSRALEEALRKLNVPYKLYGGTSFYQRKEIKDLIAYFRMAVNPQDEEALKRVINYPRRGIGNTTLERIIIAAGQHDLSLWEVVKEAPRYIDSRSAGAVEKFAVLIQSFQVLIEQQNAFDVAMHIARQSGILKELYEDKSVEGLSRYENLQELLNGLKEFSEREDIEEKTLPVFMEDVALLTNEDMDKNPDADTVSLMTIHASKGLEFPHVYIVGLEENLFPSQLSLNSRSELEEERRLFYVAITRAERNLVLSYATSRYRWGTLNSCEPSRFIDELDPRFLDLTATARGSEGTGNGFGGFDGERMAWAGGGDQFSKPKLKKLKTTQALPKAHVPSENFAPSDTKDLQVGMEVEHERFGFGKVLQIEGQNSERKATVFFKGLGQKTLLLRFAKLRVIQ